jgi:hypothetical protein
MQIDRSPSLDHQIDVGSRVCAGPVELDGSAAYQGRFQLVRSQSLRDDSRGNGQPLDVGAIEFRQKPIDLCSQLFEESPGPDLVVFPSDIGHAVGVCLSPTLPAET